MCRGGSTWSASKNDSGGTRAAEGERNGIGDLLRAGDRADPSGSVRGCAPCPAGFSVARRAI